MLTVPTPTLTYEALAPGLAPRELPLTVAAGAVTAEGVPLAPQDLAQASVVTLRRDTPAAPVEAWDSATKTWVPEKLAGPSADALFFVPGLPQPWQGLLVAAGDSRFAPAVSGYPQYSFQVAFATATESAVSPETTPVAFGSVLDRNLMVVGPGDGEKPETATQARLQLKSTALALIGGLVVQRDAGSARVTVSNSAGASIVLLPDGGIELRPGPGRSVVVAGDLDTEHLVYRPAGGGPKKTAV